MMLTTASQLLTFFYKNATFPLTFLVLFLIKRMSKKFAMYGKILVARSLKGLLKQSVLAKMNLQ